MADIWKATCMQTMNCVVNNAHSREEAMTIINKSIDRWEELLKSLVASNGSMKQLYLFPEFNLQGFPLHENPDEWIEKACLNIPGSNEIERIQAMAQTYRSILVPMHMSPPMIGLVDISIVPFSSILPVKSSSSTEGLIRLKQPLHMIFWINTWKSMEWRV